MTAVSLPAVDVSRGVVVTGTDTGVGKTLASAAICAAWLAAGIDVGYVKPVQSGAADGDDDAADVASLVNVRTHVGPVVGPSLAPAVAVRLAGEDLERDELVAVARDAMAAHDRVVVEGAGGVLVELGTDGTTVADLAADLNLPLVVVARPGLGTLNHTCLTVAEIDRRGLTLAGIVVCGYPGDDIADLATRTNLDELRRLTGDRVIGVIPHLDAITPEALTAAATWLSPPLT